MNRRERERRNPLLQHTDPLIKLFTFIVTHGKDCEIRLDEAVKRLKKFTDGDVTEKEVSSLVSSSRDKFSVKNVDGTQIVEATTTVKLCDAYQSGSCGNQNCPRLHICRHFLQDSCKFEGKCNKSHSFNRDVQSQRLLAGHRLNALSEEALKNLFKKVLNKKIIQHASKSAGAPNPCSFYNKGTCRNGDKCQFLHVCEHFVKGGCKFGEQKCKRDHHFETSHSKKVLATHGLGHLRDKKQIRAMLNNNSSSDNDSDFESDSSSDMASPQSSKSSDKSEICGFHLRGKCSYGRKCNALHANLPYQWQFCAPTHGVTWSSFGDGENQLIEKAFCNHDTSDLIGVEINDRSNCSIDFQTMDGKQYNQGFPAHTGVLLQFRRLSTVSSILAAPGHVFRTKWKWHWLDEHNTWQCYDDGTSDTTSDKIEQEFLSETGNRKHSFTNGPNKYDLHMENRDQMYQVSLRYRTKRPVQRRPVRFVDKETMKQMLEDFKTKGRQRTTSSSVSEITLPEHWAAQSPSEEFQEIPLDKDLHSEEFGMAKETFLKTMPGSTVTSIKRVQNPDLWTEYERKKSKMAKKNSGIQPEEKWLFHGTTKETVGPICQQGFDWRLCGKHGTRYGKGSYFATDASYSDNYCRTGLGTNQQMFMAKVIVGSYVVGEHGTQRPPAKDCTDQYSVLYDSCVNDARNPSIFVIFERSQAYPYYVIQYQ